MHIGGHGDATKLAQGVKRVYDQTAEVRSAHAGPESVFPGQIANPGSISSELLEVNRPVCQAVEGINFTQ